MALALTPHRRTLNPGELDGEQRGYRGTVYTVRLISRVRTSDAYCAKALPVSNDVTDAPKR